MKKWAIVKSYSLQVTASSNDLYVHLRLTNGNTQSVAMDSYKEFAAVTDLLRNEKPVYFHSGNRIFSTSWEPTGEGE